MRWRYAYPQAAFPYEDLIRSTADVADRAGVRTARHRGVRPRLVGRRGRVRQGRRRRHLHPRHRPQRRIAAGDAAPAPDAVVSQHLVLDEGAAKPAIASVDDGTLRAEHEQLGTVVLAGDGTPEPLFCDNETNARRLWSADAPACIQGWDQRPSAEWNADRHPRPNGDAGGAALSADGGGRCHRRDHAAARPGGSRPRF